jgi:hypothetical protein
MVDSTFWRKGSLRKHMIDYKVCVFSLIGPEC